MRCAPPHHLTTSPNAKIFGGAPCSCDLTPGSCDALCCCDADCGAGDLLSFGDACSAAGGSAATPHACEEAGTLGSWLALDDVLCVHTSNSPVLGLFADVPPSLASEVAFEGALRAVQESAPAFNATLTLPDPNPGSAYRAGAPIQTLAAHAGEPASHFALPAQGGPGLSATCVRGAPAAFLVPARTSCRAANVPESSVAAWEEAACAASGPMDASLMARAPLLRAALSSGSATPARSYTWSAAPCLSGGATARSSEACGQRTDDPEAVPRPVLVGHMCTFALVGVEYLVQWSGAEILRLHTNMVLGNISFPHTAQTFAIEFSSSPFLTAGGSINASFFGARSGHPGYLRGSPFLAARLDDTGGSVGARLVPASLPLLRPAGRGKNECAEGQPAAPPGDGAIIRFGEDAFAGCALALSRSDFANCTALRARVRAAHLHGLLASEATHVGMHGSALLDYASHWAAILQGGDVAAVSETDSALACSGVLLGVEAEVFVSSQGQLTNPQVQVLGMRLKQVLGTARLPCSAPTCREALANHTTAASDGEADSPAAVQQPMLVLTNTVHYTYVHPEQVRLLGEYSASVVESLAAPARAECALDTCFADMFYPLTPAYTRPELAHADEENQRATALGLVLLLLLLAVCSLDLIQAFSK